MPGSMGRAWGSQILTWCPNITFVRSVDLNRGLSCCSTPPLYHLILTHSDVVSSLRRYAKRIRQNSATSARNPSRTSRSHSPTYFLKQPPKRRNTMNSRDAAYEQQIQALIESTAAEADAAKAAVVVTTSPTALTVVIPETNGQSEPHVEAEIASASRRKRKRPDDDA